MLPRSSDETITSWTRRFLIALTVLVWLSFAAMVIWATYRYLHPEQFPHTPEPEPPPPLIPGVAPTDPEAFLPEVIAEAAGVIERKAESTNDEKGA
jgi:hypothetical protein